MSPKDFVEFVQCLSVIAASVVAILGIGSWHREFVGKRRLELAEEILALFYQAKDAVAEMCGPFSFGGEGQTRKPGPDESLQDKQALDAAFVLIERYGKHSELFSRIQAARYRFMAVFGKDAAAPFQALTALVNELIFSAHEMGEIARGRERYRPPEKEEEHDKHVKSVYRTYYGGAKDDPVATKLEKLIKDIERTCRKIIESRGKRAEP